MLKEEIKNIKSGKGELRNFGLTVGTVLGLLGGLLLWRGKDYYVYLLTPSIILVFFGLLLPNLLKPFQKVWMTLAVIMGWVMTRVILIFLFYFVITLLGILARLSGKDFLDRRFNKNVGSYWIPKKRANPEKDFYEKQF